MQITRIGGPSFNGVNINAKQNAEVKFLYNKVLDVVRENKIPATFATDYIDLPTTNKTILDKLTEFGIKFTEIIKKEK